MIEHLVETTSAVQTQALAAALGRELPDGALLGLTGALGAGKTCFVQGLGRGVEVPPEQPIVSPTFVLMRAYEGARSLYHLDLYRLGGYDELLDLGWEEVRASGAIVAVEWADRFPELAEEVDLRVSLAHAGGDRRSIRLEARPTLLNTDAWARVLAASR